MIEFTMPDHIGNKQLERFLVATEGLVNYDGITPTVKEVMTEIIEQHGAKAAERLVGSWVLSVIETMYPDTPPSEEAYKYRARKFISDGFGSAVPLRELEAFSRDEPEYFGRVQYRCEDCGRIRHGLKWRQRKPKGDGWLTLGTQCPDCERAENERHGNRHESRKPTEADLNAWLAEPTND